MPPGFGTRFFFNVSARRRTGIADWISAAPAPSKTCRRGRFLKISMCLTPFQILIRETNHWCLLVLRLRQHSGHAISPVSEKPISKWLVVFRKIWHGRAEPGHIPCRDVGKANVGVFRIEPDPSGGIKWSFGVREYGHG